MNREANRCVSLMQSLVLSIRPASWQCCHAPGQQSDARAIRPLIIVRVWVMPINVWTLLLDLAPNVVHRRLALLLREDVVQHDETEALVELRNAARVFE